MAFSRGCNFRDDDLLVGEGVVFGICEVVGRNRFVDLERVEVTGSGEGFPPGIEAIFQVFPSEAGQGTVPAAP